MSNNVDGNLAALRQYEQAQDRQDEAESVMRSQVEPLIKEIGNLAAEALSYEDDHYDWEEEIIQMIKDEMEIEL